LPLSQQRECHELNNLLYILHTTPITDHISLADIAKKTGSDKGLSRIQIMVKKGKHSIPKEEAKDISKFEPLLSGLTITGNGVLLKGDRIFLPESLQEEAIKLAHRGSHPGQSGIERRLRFHFFFHNMYNKVRSFVKKCKECSLFVDKKDKRANQTSRKSWETLAVDLLAQCPCPGM